MTRRVSRPFFSFRIEQLEAAFAQGLPPEKIRELLAELLLRERRPGRRPRTVVLRKSVEVALEKSDEATGSAPATAVNQSEKAAKRPTPSRPNGPPNDDGSRGREPF